MQPIEYSLGDVGRIRSVLEIGPGPGVGTFELLEAYPEATITCLEPGDIPRDSLVWRLFDRGLLAADSRVDVLPLTFAEAGYLGQFDLIAAHHVVCQLSDEERADFWAFVRDHLAPAGSAVVDSHIGPTPGPDVERALRAEAQVGSSRLQRWFSSSTDPDGTSQIVRTDYVLRDGSGAVRARTVAESRMPFFDRHVVEQEIADAGLVLGDQGRWWSLARSPR